MQHCVGNYTDDAMAIFVALNSPEVDVIGLTTIYGNVYTTLATRNALHLVMSLCLYCVLKCIRYLLNCCTYNYDAH